MDPSANTKQTDDPNDVRDCPRERSSWSRAPMNGSRMHMNRLPERMNSSRVSMNRFPKWSKMLRRRSSRAGIVGHRVAGRRYAALSACC
jgi:hypothetical protein